MRAEEQWNANFAINDNQQTLKPSECDFEKQMRPKLMKAWTDRG